MQRGTFTGSPPTGISGMPVLVMDRAPDPMADRRPFWKVASVALAGGCGGVVACWSVGGASPVSSIDPAGMIGPALVGAALGVVAYARGGSRLYWIPMSANAVLSIVTWVWVRQL